MFSRPRSSTCYDTGDRLDYIKAIIQLAVERDDLGPELRPWLREFSAALE